MRWALPTLLALGCGHDLFDGPPPSPTVATPPVSSGPPGTVPDSTYVDLDGDGDPSIATGGGDCDDEDPTVHSGAPRVCGNGKDDDCDAASDCDLRGDLAVVDVAASSLAGDASTSIGGSIAIGEGNGDGEPDLLAAGFHGARLYTSSLLDSRSGTDAADFDATDQFGIAFGDLDGDGLDDVVGSANRAPNPAYTSVWYASSPHGAPADAFLAQEGPMSWWGSVACGDVDGDGFDDLAIGAGIGFRSDIPSFTGGVALEYGPVAGDLAPTDVDVWMYADTGATEIGAGLVASHDVTGDGVDDLVVPDGASGVFVGSAPLVPYGDATALPFEVVPACDPHRAVTVGDVDGDGHDDLAIPCDDADWTSAVWLAWGPFGDGGAVDTDGTRLVQGLTSVSAVALPGDVDGDGADDVVVSTDGEGARLFYDPAPTLAPEDADATFVGTFPAAGGVDVDHDGRADLLLGSEDALSYQPDGAVWLVLGRPTGF